MSEQEAHAAGSLTPLWLFLFMGLTGVLIALLSSLLA